MFRTARIMIVSIGGMQQDVFKAIIAREYLATVKEQSGIRGCIDIINRHQRGKTRTGRLLWC